MSKVRIKQNILFHQDIGMLLKILSFHPRKSPKNIETIFIETENIRIFVRLEKGLFVTFRIFVSALIMSNAYF